MSFLRTTQDSSPCNPDIFYPLSDNISIHKSTLVQIERLVTFHHDTSSIMLPGPVIKHVRNILSRLIHIRQIGKQKKIFRTVTVKFYGDFLRSIRQFKLNSALYPFIIYSIRYRTYLDVPKPETGFDTHLHILCKIPDKKRIAHRITQQFLIFPIIPYLRMFRERRNQRITNLYRLPYSFLILNENLIRAFTEFG